MEKISTSEDIAIKNFQIETEKTVTKRKTEHSQIDLWDNLKGLTDM